MDTCFRCGAIGREVKLLDAIYENELVKICERCSIVEDIPIIRKPSTSQLKEAERSQGVSERLKILAGMKEKEEKHESILDQIRKLDENLELEKPREKPFNLIDNFNWHVQRARRNKGLSQKQLGWALGESETAVKMVEKGELPEEPEKLIRKLEQFLQITLKEKTEEELEQERKKEEIAKEKFKVPRTEEPEFEEIPIKPIISEEDIEERDIMFEEKTREQDKESDQDDIEGEIEEKGKQSPTKVLSFKSEVMRDITISDLQKMREEKEKEEKLEELEKGRKRKLQEEGIVQELKNEEKRKQELREKVAEEMRDIALGKKENPETIEEKRKMLNKALKEVGKTKEEKEIEEKEHVPTISELVEIKKEMPEEKQEAEIKEQKPEQMDEKQTKKERDIPTISELAERKKEESIVGDDIEVIE